MRICVFSYDLRRVIDDVEDGSSQRAIVISQVIEAMP